MGLFSKNPNLLHPLLSSKLLLLPLPLILLLHLSFHSTTTTTITTTTTTTTTTKPINHHPRPPPACNYSTGKWVPSSAPLLYNGTSCSTIKDGQNCMAHGRPDTSYLRYRWRPSSCPLPRFHPPTLLRLLRHKRIAFVGDSMARNQLESLICLLSSMDVTPMAAAWPDGHPGAYMYAYPFREGTPERVQNDCVHWCMPGPIDAWNEVLLQMVRRWQWELRERGPGRG